MGYPFGDLCKLLLLTGSRREEVARMTWAELADDLSTLRLPGNRTKNHKPHNVPLSALAREILAGAPKISDVYVFSTNGTTPISGFSKYKTRLDALMLAQATKEKGTVTSWRLHDLRRTAATGMAGIGVVPHVIEACLNHVSGAKASVAGIYNREKYEPEKRAALDRWAGYIDSVISGRADDTIVPLRGRAT
jgi:integrase